MILGFLLLVITVTPIIVVVVRTCVSGFKKGFLPWSPLLVLPFAVVVWTFAAGSGGDGAPKRSELVGTWRSENNATIVISDDGRFSFEAPTTGSVAFNESEDSPMTATTSGTWSIGTISMETPDGIVFDYANGKSSLEYEKTDLGPALFAYIGDPDDDQQYQFIKQGK